MMDWKMKLAAVILTAAVFLQTASSAPPPANMTVPEMIAYSGYPVEVHEVTTGDGYVLELHRIPSGAGNCSEARPVAFLAHCLLCSSSAFVLNDPQYALAYVLADNCYDVWMANFRGNTYSRKHKSLDPTKRKFWQFSWDEMAAQDLPAMINYTLEATGQESLSYVGHSMGTTALLAMLSEKPELNKVIKAAALLGPVAFTKHTKGAFSVLARYSKFAEIIISTLGTGEFLRNREVLNKFERKFCSKESPFAIVCYMAISSFGGFNPDVTYQDWLPAILSHNPAGSSYQTFDHYAQLHNHFSHQFRKYDHGFIGNIFHYKKHSPPSYDLTNVNTNIGLFYGNGDFLADPLDVLELSQRLATSVKTFQKVDHEHWSHFDFLWSRDARALVYEPLMEFLRAPSAVPRPATLLPPLPTMFPAP